jgi:hypothetical protein
VADINTDGFVTWRESTRKRAATYNQPFTGFTRESYGIARADIPEASLWEMVDRSYQHMLNNEVISKVGRVETKAKEEGTPFDAFKFVHDERMAMRQRVLDGALGRRSGPTIIEIDPVTREMQLLAHARLVAAATAGGRTDFPSEFNTSTAKVIISKKSGRTLGEMVTSLIENDDGTMRAKAEAKVAADKAARATDADADASALFEDDDEEDEDDSEAA